MILHRSIIIGLISNQFKKIHESRGFRTISASLYLLLKIMQITASKIVHPICCYFALSTEMKHHFQITRYLRELNNAQIIGVGSTLGINYVKLTRMHNLPGDMVAAWLRREDNVVEFSGDPTWKALSEALKENGQTGMAMKIQLKYQPGIHACIWKALHTYNSLSLSLPPPPPSLSVYTPVLLAPIRDHRIVFIHTLQFGVHALKQKHSYM